jgi:hypothetical protein
MSDNDDLNLQELDAPAESAGEMPVLGGVDGDEEAVHSATDLEAVYDIPVQVSAVIGKSHMQVSHLLKIAAPSSSSTGRWAKRSTSMSTTGWSPAARSSSSTTSSGSP